MSESKVGWGFPDATSGREPACNARDARDSGSIPGSGRSPGGCNGNPLQYSCLENPMNRRSLVGYSPWDHRVGAQTSGWVAADTGWLGRASPGRRHFNIRHKGWDHAF